MWQFGNILLGGLLTGAIYALLAVGFSLVFNVSGALNLAQGAFVAVGVLVMYSLSHQAHLAAPVAFLGALLVVTAMAGIIEWTIVRRALVRISHANLLMLMGGLLTAFEGAAFLIWGNQPYSLSPYSGNQPFRVGHLLIPTQALWIAGALVLSVGSLWWFMTRTAVGRGVSATAENVTAARLVGVPVDRMVLLSFAASGAIGVIAGAALAPLTAIDFTSMATYTNEGLIAVTLGGMGSLFGSVAGGLALGVVEALMAGYVSSLYSPSLSIFLLIVVLLVRPRGLLGKAKGVRADVADRVTGRVYMPPRLPRAVGRPGGLLVLVFLALVPVLFGSSGHMRAINIAGVFALTVVGLDLVTGIAGQVSLGQAGFMAVGAYTSGILVVNYHWPALAGMAAGLALSCLLALLLGLATARIRGMYLAIATLAFGILAETLASALGITGGSSGFIGIPSFSVGGFSFASDTRFFYLIWGLVVAAVFLVRNIARSNRGRLLRAMNGDQVGAAALGLNTALSKVQVFVLSAALASIAGSLYGGYFRFVSPDMMGSSVSLTLMTMLVVGGMGSVVGPIIGAVLLTVLPELSQSVADAAPLIDGVLLVAFLRFLRGGLWGGVLGAITAALRRMGSSSAPVKAPGIAAPGAPRVGAAGGSNR